MDEVTWMTGALDFETCCTGKCEGSCEEETKQPGARLHLGCGGRRLPGFVHVDVRPEVLPDVVADVTLLADWSPDAVDLIYACHVLEHVPRKRLPDTLRRWRQVLRPGGTLRVAVPDLGVAMQLYECGVSFWRLVGLFYGRQNYEGNTHLIGFDHEYLAWHMNEAGFYHIRRWDPADVLPEGYDDYSLARIEGSSVSLNLEATA